MFRQAGDIETSARQNKSMKGIGSIKSNHWKRRGAVVGPEGIRFRKVKIHHHLADAFFAGVFVGAVNAQRGQWFFCFHGLRMGFFQDRKCRSVKFPIARRKKLKGCFTHFLQMQTLLDRCFFEGKITLLAGK